MSDKKDKQSADLEANLAKIANTKPRLRNRKHNIYERYITRVESAETIERTIENAENERGTTVTTDAYDETNAGLRASLLDSPVQPHILQPLKNADKLSSYEPLSAAELELFGSQEQDNVENTAGLQISDNASTSVSLDFSDEDEKVIHPLITTEATDNAVSTVKDEDTEVNDSAYIDEPISTAPLTTLPIKKSKKKKAVKSIQTQKSTKKPLIIGMVLGSLMISAAVFTLIATGFLSTGTTSTALNEAGTPINKNATQTSPVTKQTATDTEMNTTKINTTEKNVVVEANTPPAVIEVPSDSDPAKSSNPKPETNAMNNEAAASTSTSKPAITYEDFREESQNTLYRETND
ncbi:hypothetical protein FQ082_00415 [Psychrobacter sp. ANT_H56B]|uniref:hypothetical protein n=1 Tax=Psychrobacter sp. ANT_H56B TaxID=2597353 RepID=UPI0011F25B67|nr:hypothetical protein [Psychrobacter sp. ANT_H56B]KAA0929223.1 hypothetical protein FQ082_00415 [Psychrobacter sp. ANT_H56B]